MTALVADRNTPAWLGSPRRSGAAAAAVLIYAGALVMRDANGNITKGQTAVGLTGVGRALARVDNSAGAAGDLTVPFEEGVFHFANSASTDQITAADIGNLCYAVDDQTVAKTDGTGTRSKAGTVADVDATGVWVRCDETLTKAR